MIDALRVRGAAYLLSAVTIGRLPQAMSALAIVRLVRDQGGDFGFAALLTAIYTVATTIGQPVLARVIDRTGRSRPVIALSCAAATAALVGLALWGVLLPVLGIVLAALAGAATPPLESSLRTLWPRMMAPGRQLQSAFSADAAAQEVLFISGPLVTALGILLFGAQGAVVLMAVLGVLGAALFALHPLLRRTAPLAVAGERAGTPVVLRGFRRLLLFQFGIAVPVGVLTISATGYGELLGMEQLGAWGLAVNAIGALTGALLIAPRRLGLPTHRLLRPVGVVFALLYLPTALVALPAPIWLALAFLAGILLPPLLTHVFAQTERGVPAAQLNEANAWTISAFQAGVAAGTLLGGLLVDLLGLSTGIAAAVGLGSAVTLLGALLARPAVLAAAR